MATVYSVAGLEMPRSIIPSLGSSKRKLCRGRLGSVSVNLQRLILDMRWGSCKHYLVTSFKSPRRRCILKGHGEATASLEKGDSQQPTLEQLCGSLQDSYFELCVKNLGRPAGAVLNDFVSSAVNAFVAGYTRDKLALQITYGDYSVNHTEGWRLTDSEREFQSQWLDIIYVTLQLLEVVDNEASRAPATDNQHLFNTVYTVFKAQGIRQGTMRGVMPKDSKLDRGLATMGASGGLVAEAKTISPGWFPVTQLVLLTLKVANDGT